MTEWFDNEAFWEDVAPALFTAERFEQAAEEVEQLVKLIGLAPGAAVLDLGCGPGRHSLALARRGFRVTGVDRTASYLETAKKRGDEQGLTVEWIRSDMRQFRREAAFDASFSLLTSFGYFSDPADDRRVLENLAASLKPGGRLVMELMGKEILARIFRQRDWQEIPDGTLVLEERRLTDDWSRLELRWIIIRDDRRREHRFFLRLYSAAELTALLRQAGFAEARACGSMKGGPYDEQAERLILVARKA